MHLVCGSFLLFSLELCSIFFPHTAMQFVKVLGALHFDLSSPLAGVSDITSPPPYLTR